MDVSDADKRIDFSTRIADKYSTLKAELENWSEYMAAYEIELARKEREEQEKAAKAAAQAKELREKQLAITKTVKQHLEALDDILVITLQYTFHATTYDVEKTYCYKFFMDFTPDNQLHYACSSSFPDKFNQGERTIILEDDIAHFLNCMSIAMWNQEMRDKGYYASFDIEHDASIITLNEKHCTITQYLAEAFHVSAEPVSNTFLKERLMPNYIKQSALEMTEKRKREQYEADMRMQSFFDRFN